MTTASTPLETVLSKWEGLGEREQKAVAMFITRLRAGQDQYGPLSPGKKNWKQEMLEELVDFAVYGIADILDVNEQNAPLEWQRHMRYQQAQCNNHHSLAVDRSYVGVFG